MSVVDGKVGVWRHSLVSKEKGVMVHSFRNVSSVARGEPSNLIPLGIEYG